MKRLISQVVFSVILLLCVGGVAFAIDPPHNFADNCNKCHNSAALLNATNLSGSIDNTPINSTCRSCHYTNGTATPKVTHSSSGSGAILRAKYGDWTFDCTACHNPHYQEQSRMYGNNGVYPNGPALYYGVLNSTAIANVVTISNTTGVTPGNLTGYTFLPNRDLPNSSYRIIGNNGQVIYTSTNMKSLYAKVGKGYAIYYGNLVLETIDRGKPITNSSGQVIDANTRYATIKVFNSSGPKSQVYTGGTIDDRFDPNTTAVCINCHTRTTTNNIGYAKFSQSFDRPEVVNAASMGHYNSTAESCWNNADCHNPPAQGFTLTAAACGECHGTTMVSNSSLVKKIKIGSNYIVNTTGVQNVGAHPKHQDQYGSTACDYCHTGGMKPTEAVLATNNSVGDYKINMFFNVTSPGSGVLHNTGVYNGLKSVSQGGIRNNAFGYNGPSSSFVNTNTATCVNVYCHGSTMPTNGGTNYTPSWFNGVGNYPCGSCHGATAANPPLLGSHPKHTSTGFNNSIMFAAQTCATCHPHNGSGSQHVNGNLEWTLAGGALYNNAASGYVSSAPSSVYASCASLYCHSNGNGNAVAIQWGSAAQNCGSCHNKQSDALGVLNWSVAHTKHLKDYGATINCNACHSTVANSNSVINLANKALHVDGNKDVVINTLNGATASYAGGTCTEVKCHGTGARLGSTTYNTPVAWNATSSCSLCHKSSDTTAIMNSGLNTMTSAHIKHVSTDEYGNRGVKPINCSTCHRGTASNGSTINSVTLHVNYTKDVSFDSSWMGGGSVWTSPNCTTNYCHSTGTAAPSYSTAVWTTASSGACGTCHGVTKTTLYNASAKHQAHINTTYYTYACSTCHSGIVSETANSTVQPVVLDKTLHVDAIRNAVFNSMASQTGTGSWNGTYCNTYCHSTGKNITVGNLAAVPAYSGSNFTNQVWSGTVACNSCHGKGNTSGRPDYTSDGPGLAGANSHLFNSGAYSHGNQACYVCHALTVNAVNTVINSTHVNGAIDVAFDGTLSGTWVGTVGSKTCSIDCHGSYTHNASKWGGAGGCTSCHEQPPTNFAGMLNATYVTGRGTGTFASNGVGKHSYHYTTKGYACDICHNGGQAGGGSHLSSPPRLDMGFKVNGNYNGLYNAPVFTGPNTVLVGNGATTYTATGTKRLCSNIYCHSNGGDYAGTSFVYQAADWDEASYTTACNQCHGNATRRATSTLHPIHENTYSYECTICHRDTVVGTSTLIGNHVNFAKDVAFDATNSLTSGTTSWARPTCSVYCHTKGTSAAGYLGANAPNYSPQWNSTLPANCVGCHSGAVGASATMNTVTHATHINNATAVGWNIGCQECHAATVSANTTVSGIANHVNRLVNIKFDNVKNLDTDGPTYIGNSTTGGPGSTKGPGSVAGNCANLYCHSIGNNGGNVFRSVTWNTSGIGCSGCHGDMATKTHPVYANTGPGVANSNSHVKHVETALYACDMCHLTTTTDTNIPPTTVVVNGAHINRVENVSFKTWGGATGTYDTGTKVCSNTYCHGASATWGATSMNCNSCHQSQGAGGTASMSPAHNLHVNTTTAYNYSCEECHDANQTSHPGGVYNAAWKQSAEVAFENAQVLWSTGQAYRGSATATYKVGKLTNNPYISASNAVTPAYAHGASNTTDSVNAAIWYTTNGTCTNVWCHSNANPVGGTNVYNTVTWNQTTSCTMCHSRGNEATSRTWSTPHEKHVRSYGSNTNLTCAACHAGTATSNTAIAAGYGFANHVNGGKDVVFSTFSNSSATYNQSTDTCSNTDCHSTGKNIPVANLTGAYAGTNYSSPVWSGTIGCNGCHGKNNGAGLPDYTTGGGGTPDANSHQFMSGTYSHGNVECNNCHALTVDITNTVIVNASAHVNGLINVAFGGAVTPGGTWTSAAKTCTVDCHGGSGYNHTASVWGGAGGCTSCHGQPPVAFATMLNGAYVTGRSTGGTFVNNGVGKHDYHVTTKGYTACDICHDGGQYGGGSHLSSPPRLDMGFKINGVTGGTYNAPAFTGPSAILVGNGATTYTATGTKRICANIYCHSDGGNFTNSAYVYKAADWDDSAYTTACNQCHGDATRRAVTTLHPIHENTYSYECTICHRNTVVGASTIIGNHVNFAKDVAFDATNSLTSGTTSWTRPNCTVYCHSKGTDPAVYTGGSAPYNTATWNATLPADCTGCHAGDAPAVYSMTTGSHSAHTESALAVGRNVGCQECHKSTVSANRTISGFANHVNRLVNVKFDNILNLDVDNTTGPTYIGNSTTPAAGSTKGPGSAAGNCANVYCHSSGNLGAGALNIYQSISWTGAAIDCTDCHGDANLKSHPVYASAGANVPNSNSHVKHVETAGYACDDCHLTTTTDGISLVINGAHLNRTEDVSFRTIGGAIGNYVAGKQCNNTYCHGASGPQWGGAAMNCNSCHQSQGAGGTASVSPAHNLHVNTTTAYAYSCTECHDDALTTHPGGIYNAAVGQAAEVVFENAGGISWPWPTNTYRGSATTYRTGWIAYNPHNSSAFANPGYAPGNANTTDLVNPAIKYTTNGTCTNVWCHSNAFPVGGTNVYNTVTWNQTTSCTFCHSSGSEATSRTWSVKHDKHVRTYGANTNFTCAACHAGTATNNTTIASGYGFLNHVNGSKNVNFSTFVNSAATYNPSPSYQCSNTYCHSEGTSYTSSAHSALAWNASALNCDSCHGTRTVANDVAGYGMPDYTNGTPKANTHWQHVGENGANCKNCHGATIESMSISNKIADYSLHVNKTYNLSAAGNFPGYGGNAVSFTVAVQGDPTTPTQCSTVSCHSGSAATWGANTPCQSCHAYNSATVENYTYLDGNKGIINATIWNTAGHGSANAYLSGNPGANLNSVGAQMCLYCHNDQAPHSNTDNFFRLKNITNATWGKNGICMDCHATGSVGITVNSVTKNGTKKVNATHYDTGGKHSTSRTGGQFCWDCHNPHGSVNQNGAKNWYMIHNTPFEVSNATTMRPMVLASNVVFTAATTGTDYANGSTFDGVCNVCHTLTGHYTKTSGDGHNSSTKCTSCHAHNNAANTKAFAGAGESTGGSACDACHADIYNRMHDGTAGQMYKHFMNSAAVFYPNDNAPAASSTNKVCLMCHVDHNIFRPDINIGNTTRGSNLRKTINSNTVTTTSGFTNSDYDSVTGGICYSCHFKAQVKTLTTNNGVMNIPAVPMANIGGSIANVVAIADTSTHIYAVNSGVFKDGSSFKAVCVKCHDDTMDVDGAGKKSSVGGQTNSPRFGTHQSSRDTFFGVLGSDSPLIETVITGKVSSLAVNTVTLDKNINNGVNGYALVITNASGMGSQRRIIASNTTTTVTIKNGQGWTFTPAANDYYEITKNITPPDEICLQCHSNVADGYKTSVNKDFYNAVSMSSNLENLYNSMFAEKGKIQQARASGSSVLTICTSNTWAANSLRMFTLEFGRTRSTIKKNAAAAADATTCSPLYGQAYALAIQTLSPVTKDAATAGQEYEMFKITHPLDKYGRHDMDEHVNAPMTNTGITNASAWASGDQGDCNAAATATTCGDATKIWATNAFVNQKITFTSGACDGSQATISSNTATTLTFGALSPTCGTPTTLDAFYVGSRHVSCNDCHNPHSAQKKAGGVGGSSAGISFLASSANASKLVDSTKTSAKTGWAANKWNGYLIVITGKDGANDTMFRQVRQINNTTTDGTGTTYGWGLPMAWTDASQWSYEVIRLNGESGPGSRGAWGVKPGGFTAPAVGTLMDPKAVSYQKVYDVAANQNSKQYELCLKCHSYYGFGSAYPTSPSGGPNYSNVLSTDVAVEFNTNNLAHHAVFGVGKNQPIPTNGTSTLGAAPWAITLNPNWANVAGTGAISGSGWVTGMPIANTVLPGWYAKTSTNTWFQVVMVNGLSSFRVAATTNGNPWDPSATYPTTGTITMITAGFGDTFVPPYGPWAIIRCTECHGSKLSDPLGPHASTNRWLIKDGENSLKFQWRNKAGAITKVTYGAGSQTFTTAYFCFNCHRADVYPTITVASANAQPNANLSRVAHGGGTTGLFQSCGTSSRILAPADTQARWGQFCRACHVGDKVGGIHGTNAKNTGATSPLNKQGRRFLNGGTWGGGAGLVLGSTSLSGSCYTGSTANNVTACSQGHSGSAGDQETTATYNYDNP